MRLVNWRTFAIGVTGFGLVACGDDVTIPPTPITVTASPAAVSCTVGQQQPIAITLTPAQQGATYTFAGAPTQAGAFTVAQIGTSSAATITCSAPGSGVVNVTAGGQTISIPVTVTGLPNGGVQGIIIAPSAATVTVGGSTTLSATVLANAGVSTAARFSSAQPNIATVDSLTGRVTGVSVGVATIIARSVANPGTVAGATVTVANPSDLVQSVVGNPQSVTLQTGQTQQLTATVTLAPNAPATTSRNVRYTSGDTSIATVSSTGLVTARRNGSTSITISSEAAPTIATSVGITVREPAPVRLSIANVTAQNNQTNIDLTQPVGTNATGANQTGSIFVTLNLDPGDATVSRVDLFLAPAASPNDTTNRVCSQVFTTTLADAYRLALQTGSADVQPITCPINLAAFDTVTGRPGIRNGAAVLRARVTGSFGGTTGATQQIAQFTQNLTITNLSGFFVRATNRPDSLQALVNARGTAQGPDGRNWVAGSLTFRILPVAFDTAGTNANVPGQVTVTLTDGNVSQTGTPATRQLSALAPAAGGAIEITFPGRTATQPNGIAAGAASGAAGNVSARSFVAADQNIDGWTSSGAGTNVFINGVGFNNSAAFNTLAVTLNGTTVVTNAGAQNQFPGSFQLNIDNQAPQPATQFNVLDANFTTTATPARVGFLGREFAINAPTASNATANFRPFFAGGATLNADFGGVDRVTTTFFAALNANLSSLTAGNVFSSGTQFGSGNQLAAANSNEAYSAAARYVDVLGNARNQLVEFGPITLDANGQIAARGTPVTFGVDLTDPVFEVANLGSLVRVINASNSATANNDIQARYQDDVGFGATPILVLGTRQARAGDVASGALRTYCFTGLTGGVATFNPLSTAETGQACTAIPVFATTLGTQQGTGTIGVTNTETGQYTFDFTARDQGGNRSQTVRVQEYVDIVAPIVGGVSIPQTLVGNQSVTFTAAASDNLELGTAFPQISYGPAAPEYGTGELQIAYTASQVELGRAFDDVFTSSRADIPITIPQFIRSLTPTVGTAPGTPTQANLAQAVVPVVTDAAILAGTQSNQGSTRIAIPLANINQNGFGATIFDTGNQTSDVNFFSLAFDNGNAGFAGQISLGGTSGAPTSGTFTVTTAGQIGAFINPFVRVEIYYSQVAGPAIYQRIAQVPIGLVTDNTGNPATVGRVITSPLTFSAIGTPLAAGVGGGVSVAYRMIAVGITANGDALVSQPVVVTIIP